MAFVLETMLVVELHLWFLATITAMEHTHWGQLWETLLVEILMVLLPKPLGLVAVT
jgi:hypothetical protein